MRSINKRLSFLGQITFTPVSSTRNLLVLLQLHSFPPQALPASTFSIYPDCCQTGWSPKHFSCRSCLSSSPRKPDKSSQFPIHSRIPCKQCDCYSGTKKWSSLTNTKDKDNIGEKRYEKSGFWDVWGSLGRVACRKMCKFLWWASGECGKGR